MQSGFRTSSSPDPKARVTLRQQLSCGAPQRQKDTASSQCRSRARTAATWSRQRPAVPGSPSPPRQAPGYGRWHHRLSSSRSAEGYSILRAVFPPSSCEVSGMLPGGRLLPCRSLPRTASEPRTALSFDSALLPIACDGALAPSPGGEGPSVRKCSPLLNSPSGTRGPGPGPGGGVECGASQEDKRAFTRAPWLRAGSRNEQGPRWTGRAVLGAWEALRTADSGLNCCLRQLTLPRGSRVLQDLRRYNGGCRHSSPG